MLIAFIHAEASWSTEEVALQRKLARIMMASARGHRFVQLTDMDTQLLCERAIRLKDEGHRVRWACRLFAGLPRDTLILDTDVVLRGDPTELLRFDADLVVTRRSSEKKIAGRYMPHLFGVCLARNPAVWNDIERLTKGMTGDDAKWWGIQVALPQISARIHEVPCAEWNYTPRMNEQSDAKALHYKGKRKERMLTEWGHLLT